MWWNRWWAAMVSGAWKTQSPHRWADLLKYRQRVEIIVDTDRRQKPTVRGLPVPDPHQKTTPLYIIPSENRLCSQPQVSADSWQIPEIVGRAESRPLNGILSLLPIFRRQYLHSWMPPLQVCTEFSIIACTYLWISCIYRNLIYWIFSLHSGRICGYPTF